MPFGVSSAIMNSHIGEIAALGTSVSWTVAALLMEHAVAKVGVMAVNTLKVAFGSAYLAILALLLTGHPFPVGLSASAWLFLGASGLIGFVIGDYFLLHAYVLVGSAMAMLLMSISVPLTAVAAFFVFGERLGNWALAGMALCVTGVSVTIASGNKTRRARADAAPGAAGNGAGTVTVSAGRGPGSYAKGVAYGILSAVTMAAATLCTKAGAVGVDSVWATQIRIGSALFGFIAFALATGKLREVGVALRDRRALPVIALGGVFGPFVGVGLLLFAIQHAEAGVVSTLSSLSPVFLLPPTALLLKRRVTLAETGGAILAMVGLALIFR